MSDAVPPLGPIRMSDWVDMTTSTLGRPPSPFAQVPSGIALAHYFWEETDHRNPGCDGIDLYREGPDYCYLWVEAMVDSDLFESYLLDVRTKVGVDPSGFNEWRDYLFLHVGGPRFEVEWFNQPVRFDAPCEKHMDHLNNGLHWFADKVVEAMEANR